MPNAYDASKVLQGPAVFKWNNTVLGHTSGGIDFDFKPAVRMQNVDIWGKSGINAIHQGDEIKIKVPLAEWTAASLQESFGSGNDQTGSGSGAYMGLGRTAGYRYIPGAVSIIPILTADIAKYILLHRAVPIGEIKLPFIADKDRIFETEFTGLIDETKADGELIGKIFLN
jgi:hypothetical protein